jgi:urea transporter
VRRRRTVLSKFRKIATASLIAAVLAVGGGLMVSEPASAHTGAGAAVGVKMKPTCGGSWSQQEWNFFPFSYILWVKDGGTWYGQQYSYIQGQGFLTVGPMYTSSCK